MSPLLRLTLLCLLLAPRLYAQQTFERFTMADGLSFYALTSLLQDRDGFL